LLDEFISPGLSKGSFEWIRREGKEVGAVLRTKDKVKPLFVSSGHRIDLMTSIRLTLETCRGFRIPEPLRKAHRVSCEMMYREQIKNSKSQFLNSKQYPITKSQAQNKEF
jgi:deoxyinosine 3'endonuclease (endonuclease V)